MEEARNVERWGVQQPPTVLGYGVTLTDDELAVSVLSVTRKLRKADRTVTLMREGNDGKVTKRRVRIEWSDALKPALWGDATFRVI